LFGGFPLLLESHTGIGQVPCCHPAEPLCCILFHIFFSYFQMDCAVSVEFLDDFLHFGRDSIFGEYLEKKRVIDSVKGFD